MQSDEFQIDTGFKQDAETQLWVEKFKPKDYFELLSDDVSPKLFIQHSKLNRLFYLTGNESTVAHMDQVMGLYSVWQREE